MLMAASWSVDIVLTQWHFLVEVNGSDSIENNPTCQWKVIKSLEWPMLNYIKKCFFCNIADRKFLEKDTQSYK